MEPKPQVYQLSTSWKSRNILDSSSDSEPDHEPQSKRSRPTGTVADRLNVLVGRRSSSPGIATINSHSQQHRTTLVSSPSTGTPSPPNKDNYNNANGNTSAEENNLIKKTGERCVQDLSQTPYLDSDSGCNSSNISSDKIQSSSGYVRYYFYCCPLKTLFIT